MSNSLFDIPEWGNNTAYGKYDIVKVTIGNTVFYYYAGYAHTSHITQPFAQTYTENPGLWLGKALDMPTGLLKPEFSWIPSYNSNFDSSPKVKVIKFGDGYEQRSRDGINSVLIILDLLFDGRDINEATAIEHFLFTRESAESFLFTPPAPYIKKKKFVCRNWQNSNVFYNNFTVKAKFEEVAN